MQLFGRTQPLAHLPIGKALEVLKQLGFSGVELCLEHPDLAPERLTANIARDVGRQARSLELACSVSYHKDYIHDDRRLEETLEAIRLTPAFGAQVFVFAGAPPHRGGSSDDWERMLQRTGRLLQAATEAAVTLAVEFEPGFVVGCTADLHRLFDAIPSARLKANLDLGHVFLCDPDPLDAIAGLKGQVAHVHIENMRHGVHRHLPPWEGDMQLEDYVGALAAIGYDGPVALDLYHESYEEVGARAVELLEALFKTHRRRSDDETANHR